MNRPTFTDANTLAGLMPVIIGVPCDRELLQKAAIQTAAELRGNPWLAEWYHLPFVSMVCNVLRAALADVPTWHATDPKAIDSLPHVRPTRTTDEQRRNLLARDLATWPKAHLSQADADTVADQAFGFFAEHVDDSDDAWAALCLLLVLTMERAQREVF